MYFFPYQEYQLITETKQKKIHASSFYIHQHANLVIFNKLERTSWACHCTYQNFGDLWSCWVDGLRVVSVIHLKYILQSWNIVGPGQGGLGENIYEM